MGSIRSNEGLTQNLFQLVQEKKQAPQLESKDIAEVEARILADGKVAEAEVDLLNELLQDRFVPSEAVRGNSSAARTLSPEARFEAISSQNKLEKIVRLQNLKPEQLTPEVAQLKATELKGKITDLQTTRQRFELVLKNTQDPKQQELLKLKIQANEKETEIYQKVVRRLDEGLGKFAAASAKVAAPAAPKPATEQPGSPAQVAAAPAQPDLNSAAQGLLNPLAQGQLPTGQDLNQAQAAFRQALREIESQSLSPEAQARLKGQLETLFDSQSNLGDRLKALTQISQDYGEGIQSLYQNLLKDQIPPAIQKILEPILAKSLDPAVQDTVIRSLETLADDNYDLNDLKAINELLSLAGVDLRGVVAEQIGSRLTPPLKELALSLIDKATDPDLRAKVQASLEQLTNESLDFNDLKALADLADVLDIDLKQTGQKLIADYLPAALQPLATAALEILENPAQRETLLKALNTLGDDNLNLQDLEAVADLLELLGPSFKAGLSPLIDKAISNPQLKELAGTILDKAGDKDFRDQLIQQLRVLGDGEFGVADLGALVELDRLLGGKGQQLLGQALEQVPGPVKELAQQVLQRVQQLSESERNQAVSALKTLGDGEFNSEDLVALVNLGGIFQAELQTLYAEYIQPKVPADLNKMATAVLNKVQNLTAEQRQSLASNLQTLSDDNFDLNDVKALGELAQVFGSELKELAAPLLKQLDPQTQALATGLLSKLVDPELGQEVLKQLDTLGDDEYNLQDLRAIAKLSQIFENEAGLLLQPLIDKLPGSTQKVAQKILDTLTDPSKSEKILGALERLSGEHSWDLGDGLDDEIEDIKALFTLAESLGLELAQGDLLNRLAAKIPGLKLAFDEKTQKLEIGLLAGKSGKSTALSGSYDFKNGTYGLNVTAGTLDQAGRNTELAGSVAYRYAERSMAQEEQENTALVKQQLSDLPESLQTRLKAEAEAYGLDLDKASVVFQVSYDTAGNVTAKATLEVAEDIDPPRFQQLELGLDINLQGLAEDALKYLAKKHGPVLAARLGVTGIATLSKAIPVAGQLITAAQVGYTVGRFIGENVTIGGKTVDQHSVDFFRSVLEGEFADAEAQEMEFKSAIATLRMAYRNILSGQTNPPTAPIPEGDPRRQVVDQLFGVKMLAYTAMARPDSLSMSDRDNALKTLEQLQESNAIGAAEASQLKKSLLLKQGGTSGENLEALQAETFEQLSTPVAKVFSVPDGLKRSSSQIKNSAVETGRAIVSALREGKLNVADAETLMNRLGSRLNFAVREGKLSTADVDMIYRLIANLDPNRGSNTVPLELGIAEYLEHSRQAVQAAAKP